MRPAARRAAQQAHVRAVKLIRMEAAYTVQVVLVQTVLMRTVFVWVTRKTVWRREQRQMAAIF